MKKNKEMILQIKEDFLAGKNKGFCRASALINGILILSAYTILYASSAMLYFVDVFAMVCSFIASMILVFCFLFCEPLFFITMPISREILIKFFCRYGNVVCKKDWKSIKEFDRKAYKWLLSRESIGHCYFTSWYIANSIEDAKIMYCSMSDVGGHAVVLKNNCIYDHNLRQHFNYEEYMKLFEVKVYKIFEKEEYCTYDFFDNIRPDFVNWCAECNVYCDPQ